MLLNTKKSATRRFFLLCLLCLPVLASAQNCPSSHYDESVIIKYVHDGDTVKLVDGRKIRLIGINAPEVAKDGLPAEAYALKARDYLREILAKHNNHAKLVHGKEALDHYNRSLSHLFLPDGINLQAQLLSSGLVNEITIPPNNQFSNCYQQAEKQALCDKKALWSHEIQTIAELDDLASGFRVLRGKVLNIKSSRNGLWLTIEYGLSLRIAFKHKPLFDINRLKSLINQNVIVRGWLQQKKQPKQGERFYMQIKHPTAIVQEINALKC